MKNLCRRDLRFTSMKGARGRLGAYLAGQVCTEQGEHHAGRAFCF
ncbi:hypothetical protein [Streptomyces roseoverticillatus]|uniref:Uncharacterized protein n=1 Tax=Streptomyces roseoverticillatus TaxID=66429 RepID=A0ABV3IQ74_9ACTN